MVLAIGQLRANPLVRASALAWTCRGVGPASKQANRMLVTTGKPSMAMNQLVQITLVRVARPAIVRSNCASWNHHRLQLHRMTSCSCASSSSSSSSSASSSASAVKKAAAAKAASISASSSAAATAIKEKSSSHFAKIKELWHKYGFIALGTYFSLYGVVLGSFYVAIEYGFVSVKKHSKPGDAEKESSFNLVTATNKYVSFAEKMGFAQYLDLQRVNPKTGSFLVAWAATKFTEPLRLAVTLAITPRVYRWIHKMPKIV